MKCKIKKMLKCHAIIIIIDPQLFNKYSLTIIYISKKLGAKTRSFKNLFSFYSNTIDSFVGLFFKGILGLHTYRFGK